MRPSSDNIKHNASILLSHHGSDATPAYSLRHPDPSLPASKNRYAAALYDSYCPEILFGEVLLIPQWTQPSLSAEEIRLNGGVTPPPQPVLPTEFTIQLYNPDQQVVIKSRPGSWNRDPCWEFEMPQQSFRQPSNSTLDRTQSDPTASETTPKVNFKWKKEGKLSREYVCSLSGKSTNPDGSKRKNKEPDITIALFRHLKEITLYEPNLNRVDTEDPKGLEVVLLLSSIVIREVYNAHIREVFNITENPQGLTQDTKLPKTPCPIFGPLLNPTPTQSPQQPRRSQEKIRNYSESSQRLPLQTQTSNPRPPPTDPRSQWEIDAETARLKKQVEREERERRHAERAQEKRVKRMLEEEERRARQKQADIDRETERLRREFEAEKRRYQQQTNKPALPTRPEPQQNQYFPAPVPRPQPAQPQFPVWQNQQRLNPPRPTTGPYLQPNASSSVFLGGGTAAPSTGRVKARKSYWGLRGHGGVPEQQRLHKKQSSVF